MDEQIEKRFAVRASVERDAAVGRECLVVLVVILEIGDDVRETLRSEEERVVRPPAPAERQRVGELSHEFFLRFSLVRRSRERTEVARTALVGEPGGERDRFEERRLARPVLPDEERHARCEPQRRERSDRAHAERERLRRGRSAFHDLAEQRSLAVHRRNVAKRAPRTLASDVKGYPPWACTAGAARTMRFGIDAAIVATTCAASSATPEKRPEPHVHCHGKPTKYRPGSRAMPRR